MDRDDGLRALGLRRDAGSQEVEVAYRVRCLPLKTQILCSRRVLMKDQHKEDLRTLVLARDAALGRMERKRWTVAALALSGHRLLKKIGKTATDHLDERGARAFFGLPAHADENQVMEAYQVRKRALIRSFVTSHDDDELLSNTQ